MIDTEATLAAFLPVLEKAEWIAIDTEADSLHAYPEKLCLLQISVPGRDAIVDPLAGLDLSPIFAPLKKREIILHGADYDLRLLRRSQRFVPQTIFDTMWAARLLGLTEFGLTHLVQKYLGVALEKGPQKMNWAQRPLPERMERYARNDTRYLQPLAELLRNELAERNRLGWMEQTCAQLIVECSQERVSDPEEVWRIRGSDRLSRPALAILRELWHWREAEAIEKNRPPYFIMSHELLVSLAGAAATAESRVEQMLPRHFSVGRRQRFQAALERGLKVPAEGHPKHRRSFGQRLDKREQTRFEELRQRRDKQAAQLSIDPTLIASRAMLVTLAREGEVGEAGLLPWQRALLKS